MFRRSTGRRGRGTQVEPPADGFVYANVRVDERAITFAVELPSPDPIAQALGEGHFPDDASNRLWRHLLRPGQTVLDVGAHLGTYALPAAAIGANVIAVEASATNAELLRLAASRNSFANLHVLHAAATAEPGTVSFKPLGPWGHILFESERAEGQKGATVEAVALDDVIRAHGCERIDLMKMDVEGFELDALAGLGTLLARDDAPPFLIEANGHTLHETGHVPGDLLSALEQYGYECFQVNSCPEHRLVRVRAGDVQPECVTDYLVVKGVPDGLAPWQLDGPLDRAETIARVLTTCQHGTAAEREYGARLLAGAPRWLLADESIQQAQRSLVESR
jgi:FkbM family methyltransferase